MAETKLFQEIKAFCEPFHTCPQELTQEELDENNSGFFISGSIPLATFTEEDLQWTKDCINEWANSANGPAGEICILESHKGLPHAIYTTVGITNGRVWYRLIRVKLST